MSTTTEKKSPKNKLNRKDIIQCAAQLIAQDGLHQLTMRRLAKALNCSVGTLPHYFSGKDEIVESALEWSTERILSRVAAVTEDDANIDIFIPIIQSTLPFDEQADLEWRVRLNLWNYAHNHEDMRKTLEILGETSIQLLADWVDILKSKERIRADISTQDTAHQLYHMVNGLAFNLLPVEMSKRLDYLKPIIHYMDSLRI